MVTDLQKASSKLHNGILSYSKFLMHELLLISMDLYPVGLSGSLKSQSINLQEEMPEVGSWVTQVTLLRRHEESLHCTVYLSVKTVHFVSWVALYTCTWCVSCVKCVCCSDEGSVLNVGCIATQCTQCVDSKRFLPCDCECIHMVLLSTSVFPSVCSSVCQMHELWQNKIIVCKYMNTIR